jgi:beta-lactam-binding protein with PASTA domain
MLPARCPKCGARLGNLSDAMGAESAQASRKSVEGLTGIGKGSTANKKRHARQLAIAVVLAFFAGAVIFGCFYFAKQASATGLPDVVGWRTERAQEELEGKGYQVVVDEVASSEASGKVISMYPEAGTKVDEGSTVTLEVAIARIMPDVIGLSQDEAVALVEAQNIPYELEDEISDDEAGVCVASTILVGNEVTGDAKTILTITKHPTVPDLIGKTRDEARVLLEAQGLKMEVKTVPQVTGVPIGQIVKSDPVAGTELAKGDTVTVNVTTAKSKTLESAAKAVVEAVYNTDVANDAVGANLRSLLSADSPYANSSDHDIWYQVVKAHGASHDGVDQSIQELDRRLNGTVAYTVNESTNTVVAEVPVLWYWDNFGTDYQGVTSSDVHTVTMVFDDEGGLLSVTDPQSDVPSYELVTE